MPLPWGCEASPVVFVASPWGCEASPVVFVASPWGYEASPITPLHRIIAQYGLELLLRWH